MQIVGLIIYIASDSLSYIVLGGRWRNAIDVNVHAPSEGKSDKSKGSFYEELEQVFDHFPKYRNRRERDHWGVLGVDRWIILGRISRRWDVGIWTGLGWSRIETGGGRL